MITSNYQICSRCIMDTSDPEIQFDELGVCNHCYQFDVMAKKYWFPNDDGKQRLGKIIENIIHDGKGKEYDSIVGLSGGVDSSYLAYKAKEFGLRPLVMHVDGGWNSELAVSNIENICKLLGYDLHTHVVDWEDMRDLQLSFLRSGTANQDIPQDHAFFVALYSFAVKNNIRYVLNGSNIATESILPKAWGYNALDAKFIKAIHKTFGTKKLRSFPTVSFFRYHIYFPYIRKMQIVKPLNFLPYHRDNAKKLLESELGWKDYGEKHFESRFTKFFQGYFLPRRFGYDKRRAHFSSLIVSGQLSREDALILISSKPYSEAEINEDREFIISKLEITDTELDNFMTLPHKTFRDYQSNAALYDRALSIRNLIRQVL